MKNATRLALLFLALMGSVACTAKHASRAYLYDESFEKVDRTGVGGQAGQVKKSKAIRAPRSDYNIPFGSNPVYVAADSKFSIRLDEVYAGWLAPAKFTQDSAYKHQRVMRDNLQGKELWVLTTITSQDSKDPLEAKSKRYFKSTSVKLGSSSFSAIPLDEAESIVFTHDADMAYRVRFQVYEVDGLAFKRELRRALDDPGIAGVITDAIKTLGNAGGALAGQWVTSRITKAREEDLALERLLLLSGATEEFFAEVHILREGKFESIAGAAPLRATHHVLADWFKQAYVGSGDNNPDLRSPSSLLTTMSTYKTAIDDLHEKVSLGADSNDPSTLPTLRFTIEQSLSPTATGKKALLGYSIADVERDLNLIDAAIGKQLHDASLGREGDWASVEVADALVDLLRSKAEFSQSTDFVDQFAVAVRRFVDGMDILAVVRAELDALPTKTNTLNKNADIKAEEKKLLDIDVKRAQAEQQRDAIIARLRASANWFLNDGEASRALNAVCPPIAQNQKPLTCVSGDQSKVMCQLCQDRAVLRRYLDQRDQAERLLAHLLRTPD